MFFRISKSLKIYVFAITFFVALVVAVLSLRHNLQLSSPSKQTADILRLRSAMPTELNANFLTQVNECFIPTAEVYGYTLRITSGFRTTQEQTELYQQGRTVDGHIVSWAEAGKSIHNYGYAVDVVDRWRGFNINWKRLAEIGTYCGFAQVDDPHFEHRGGLATEDFVAGLTPPPLTLPCALMGERARAAKSLTLEDLKFCDAPKF